MQYQILFAIFLVAILYTKDTGADGIKNGTEKLLLVNIFNRHGDRAPTGKMPPGDPHQPDAKFFWPRGFDNLTSTGRLRMYNLGVALRQYYEQKGLLDYNTDSVLAFTSNVLRCKESQEATLQGFYEITSSLEHGHKLARLMRLNRIQSLPVGLGTSSAWQQVKQDTEFIRSLDYTYYANSMYNKNHPAPLFKNLDYDRNIKALTNIHKLRRLLADRYKLPFTLVVAGPWTAIECELYLDRTKSTINYTRHYADWIDEPVIIGAGEEDKSLANQNVTMYELYEETVLLAFIGMADVNSDYLVVGPIINSLIESQSVANGEKPANERSEQYLNKNIIFYSTHDSILATMLFDLGIVTTDGASFGRRMMVAKRDQKSHLDMYLEGLKMCHMGLSVKFELWSIGADPDAYETSNMTVVRLAMYNEADPDLQFIKWHPVPLGRICRRRFKQLYPDSIDELQRYLKNNTRLKYDSDFDCPFALFKRIAAPWFLNETRYEQIYNDEL